MGMDRRVLATTVKAGQEVAEHIRKDITEIINKMGGAIARSPMKGNIRSLSDTIRRLEVFCQRLKEYASIPDEATGVELIDVIPIVQRMVDVPEFKALQKGRTVHFSFERVPKVQVNPILLTRLYYHVLHNALTHTTRGMLTIGFTYELVDGLVVLGLKDNGVGLLPEEVDKAVQFGQHFSEMSDGFGIGLAICEKIAQAHGGWIKVSSGGRNIGTHVQFCLGSEFVREGGVKEKDALKKQQEGGS